MTIWRIYTAKKYSCFSCTCLWKMWKKLYVNLKKWLVNASVKTFQKKLIGIIWSRVFLWNYPIKNSPYQIVTPSTPHPHDTQVMLTKLILTEIIFSLYSFSYPASAKQFCLFCIEIDVFFKVDPMPDAKWKNLGRYVQGRSFWKMSTNHQQDLSECDNCCSSSRITGRKKMSI